jgi:hypothetical protein
MAEAFHGDGNNERKRLHDEYSEDEELCRFERNGEIAIVYPYDTIIAFSDAGLVYVRCRVQSDTTLDSTPEQFAERYYRTVDTDEPSNISVKHLKGQCTRAKIPAGWSKIVFANPVLIRGALAVMGL